MSAQLDKAALASLLSKRIGQLANELLGPRAVHLSSRTDWRWRSKGSLCVVVSGARVGWWFDHEAGVGGDALALIQRERRCSFPDALHWAANWVGSAGVEPLTATLQRRAIGSGQQNRTSYALRLWAEADDARGTLAEHYLNARGLALPYDAFEVLRFHPRLRRGDEQCAGMLALFRDLFTDEPCGIHRTFLAADGSRLDKRMLGRVRGTAIKLCSDDGVTTGLGVAEGIETALSIMSTGWRPVWALGSAGAIRRLPVLSGVDALTIFADHDETGVGEAAAGACAATWSNAGREVTIAVPNVGGEDFNDCLVGLRRAS
jgi:hypothetical protein